MKLPCELIRDLLPLYAEHLTSPETGQLIEEHLQSCRPAGTNCTASACQSRCRPMRRPTPR